MKNVHFVLLVDVDAVVDDVVVGIPFGFGERDTEIINSEGGNVGLAHDGFDFATHEAVGFGSSEKVIHAGLGEGKLAGAKDVGEPGLDVGDDKVVVAEEAAEAVFAESEEAIAGDDDIDVVVEGEDGGGDFFDDAVDAGADEGLGIELQGIDFTDEDGSGGIVGAEDDGVAEDFGFGALEVFIVKLFEIGAGPDLLDEGVIDEGAVGNDEIVVIELFGIGVVVAGLLGLEGCGGVSGDLPEIAGEVW